MPDDTPRIGLDLWAYGDAAPWTTVSSTLGRLDALVQAAVEDRDLAAPPGSPAEGACYIVATSPTGAWTGQAGKVAQYLNAGWIFITPFEGLRVWVKDEDLVLVYGGTAWAPQGIGAYIMPIYQHGTAGASAIPQIHVVTDACTLPAGLAGSRAKAGVGATAETIVSIQKNGTEIGTATFAAAATTATFAAASPTSLVPGDLVRVVFPNPADATLANIAITLRAPLA